MGDGEKASLRLQFNPKIRLEFPRLNHHHRRWSSCFSRV